MTGSVFMETLRRSWRGMLYWAMGMGIYGFVITSFIQDANMLKQYSELSKAFPPALLEAFGVDAQTMGTPEGFLGLEFFSYSLLITAIYAVMAGLNITANEEDAGILDVLLSLPLPRWRVVVEKFVAYVIMVVVIIVLTTARMYLGSQSSALKVDNNKLVQSCLNMLPGTLLMLAAATFSAVFFRSKGTATAAVTVFVIGSFFLNFLGEAAGGTIADQLRGMSFFYYVDYTGVIQNGLNWGNMAVLLVATVVLLAGSIWFFQRRDVAV
jgi:ABC-2 type transport system permease protein